MITLDAQLKFLQEEIRSPRSRTERWAEEKARKLEAVYETVRTARQNEVMTSALSSKRIDA